MKTLAGISMRRIRTLILFAVPFSATHLLGLYTAQKYLALGFKTEISPNPYHSAGIILLVVMLWTAVLLLIMKYLGVKPIKVLVASGLLCAMIVVFDPFLPFILSLSLPVGILALRFMRPSTLIHNLAMVLSLAGASVSLGLSLNVVAMIVILGALSLYDVIAVFGTKHMVKLGRGLTEGGVPLAIGVPGPLKGERGGEEVFEAHQLGAGDIAMPLVLAITVLDEYGMASALAVSVGSLIGLAVALLWVYRIRKPIPALPPISALALMGLLISL